MDAKERAEWWILTVAAEDLTPAWRIREQEVGRRHDTYHGLSNEELVPVLYRLFQQGDLLAARSAGLYLFEEYIPTLASVEAAIVAGRREPDLLFCLSEQGAARWEASFRPDWERYLECYSRRPGCWEIVGGSREAVEAELLRWREPISNTFQEPSWDTVSPWNPTYWKQLPVGHWCSFHLTDEAKRKTKPAREVGWYSIPHEIGDFDPAPEPWSRAALDVAHWKQVVRQAPTDATLHRALGNALLDAGEIQAAIAALEEAVRLAHLERSHGWGRDACVPGGAEMLARWHLGRALHAAECRAEAQRELEHALQLAEQGELERLTASIRAELIRTYVQPRRRCALESSVGVLAAGGEFLELVPAGLKLPYTHSVSFCTQFDDQTSARVAVVQQHEGGDELVMSATVPVPAGLAERANVVVTVAVNDQKQMNVVVRVAEAEMGSEYGPFNVR